MWEEANNVNKWWQMIRNPLHLVNSISISSGSPDFDLILMILHVVGLSDKKKREEGSRAAVWLTSCRSLMSELVGDLWLRYLIQKTEDHDREGDYQADIIPSGVVTLVFNSLRLSADNEVFLAPWLCSALTCPKLHFDMCHKICTRSHFYLEFVRLRSLPN